MRLLRWKNRYRSGDQQQDRENQSLAGCLNHFLEAAQTREHCQELDDLLASMVKEADTLLLQGMERPHIQRFLRRILIKSLPLQTHGTPACRKCGICDLSRDEIPAHITEPAQCMLDSAS